MATIIGRFYFKLTDAGNLIGEYSNSAGTRSLPESAMRKDGSEVGGFVSSYMSTWFEPSAGAGVAALLKIEPKSESSDLFELTWCEIAGNSDLYKGEAMLCDGMLIGNYWSV